MGIKLKSGQTFVDLKKGGSFPNAYGMISRMKIDPINKWAHVFVDIFASKDIRDKQSPNNRIHSIELQFRGGSDWDACFTNGNLSYTNIYNYMLAHESSPAFAAVAAVAAVTADPENGIEAVEAVAAVAAIPKVMLIDPMWESDE